ncbi:hypothetical protein ACFE04_031518 [Oxalis oulophora]
MSTSVDSPHKDSTTTTSVMGSASPMFSPSSDKRFWSTLRSRVDSLIEDRNKSESVQVDVRVETEMSKRLKEDSTLLLRGFDSVAQTLSLLSNNIDNALQGARDLAKPPTLTEIFHSKVTNAEENPKKQQIASVEEDINKKGTKRKFDLTQSSDDDQQDESNQIAKNKHMKKAKNLAVSMATKAASLAREMKSVRSDLSFMQERCSLLEEENRRLRDGFTKGVRPEEDDLLVEYHKVASEDLSASYEEAIQGMCLNFDSPIPYEEDANNNSGDEGNRKDGAQMPGAAILDFSANLDDCFNKDE